MYFILLSFTPMDNLPVFGRREEAGAPGRTPRRHRENILTPYRKVLPQLHLNQDLFAHRLKALDLNPGPSCCEATVPNAEPTCCPNFYTVLFKNFDICK